MNKKLYSPKYVIELSRQLRAGMTETEKLLWNKLECKKLDGFRFRKQHPIGRYIVDFYCHSLKLAIEVDGEIHDSQKEYDNNRDNFLSALGCSVLRFSNKQITENLAEVISFVQEHIKKSLQISPPSGDLGGS
jgi:very-short-patch-repair endonuclease